MTKLDEVEYEDSFFQRHKKVIIGGSISFLVLIIVIVCLASGDEHTGFPKDVIAEINLDANLLKSSSAALVIDGDNISDIVANQDYFIISKRYKNINETLEVYEPDTLTLKKSMLVTNQAIDQADSTKVKMSDHSVLTQYTYGPDKKSDNIIYLTNTQGDPSQWPKRAMPLFFDVQYADIVDDNHFVSV